MERPVDREGTRLRAATAGDLESVRRLLAEAALPPDGLEAFFPGRYVVAVGPDGIVAGAAGLETYGRYGLLRSVAVAPAARGGGIGESLVRDRLEHARLLGLAEVHLLTTTAAPFFLRLGFAPVERARVPPEIRASVEFARACPETAAAMRRGLGEGGSA